MQSQGVVSAGSRRGMRSRQCSAGSENEARTAITNPSAPQKPGLRSSLKVACNSPTPDFTNPRNVAIATPVLQHVKGCHGNCMRHFRETTQSGDAERPRSRTQKKRCTRLSAALHQLGSITPVPSWCNTHPSGVTPLKNKRGRGAVESIQPYRQDSTSSGRFNPIRRG